MAKDGKRPSYYGHRERVRQRFINAGLNGFADHEILEMALFYTIRYIDTKEIAKELIKEFGSLEKVFVGSYERIVKIVEKDGRPSSSESKNTALFIKFIRSLAGLLWRRKAQSVSVVISNGKELLKYLETEMKDLNEEQMRIIYIDNGNKILKDEVISEGTEDQTAVYPKKIIRRALEINSTGIVVVHNHPAGRLSPSNADVSITRAIAAAADLFSIRVLDHLIIGNWLNSENKDKGYFSFRENGLI